MVCCGMLLSFIMFSVPMSSVGLLPILWSIGTFLDSYLRFEANFSIASCKVYNINNLFPVTQEGPVKARAILGKNSTSDAA